MTNVLFGVLVMGVVVGVLLFLVITSIGLWVITLMMSKWLDSYTGYYEKNQRGNCHDEERSSRY